MVSVDKLKLGKVMPGRFDSSVDEEDDIEYEEDVEVEVESTSGSESDGVDMSINTGLMNFLSNPTSLKQSNKSLGKGKSTAAGSRKAGRGQIVTDSIPIYDPTTCRKSEVVSMS